MTGVGPGGVEGSVAALPIQTSEVIPDRQAETARAIGIEPIVVWHQPPKGSACRLTSATPDAKLLPVVESREQAVDPDRALSADRLGRRRASKVTSGDEERVRVGAATSSVEGPDSIVVH